MKRLLAVAFAALVFAPPASAMHPAGLFSMHDQVITMDDGVGIATTTYIPVEHAPHPGVFPAVMVFHGLAGNRGTMAPIAEVFARRGYVVLTFDFRGHGQSGGLFTGLGARELADVAILRERWLPMLAPIRGDRVGAWGISLGGGAALRSAAEGEPFAAIEVVETWTDLYGALVPQNLPKTGAIFQFLRSVPRERQAPEFVAIGDAVARRDVQALRTFSQARSTSHLPSRTPTLFFQGRRDFAFGLEQGISAWQRLRGPKALYIGPFGHAPSRFPGPDFDVVAQRSLQWFDTYLGGLPAPPDMPPVELAPETFPGRTRGSSALPATRTLRFVLPGRSTVGGAGKVVRRARVASFTETFGAPTVRVQASSTTGWSHLIAVLVARTRDGREIVVSEGGAPTRLTRRARPVTIRLISQATVIPAGSRLEVTLAATSTAQNPANLLYLVPVREGARITLGKVELRVPVLRTPVSRR
jgi:predicted acyl esterase